MDALNWRKASHSASNGGGCVEVGNADHVLVRDTNDRTGPVLRFTPDAWRRFADRVKRSLTPGPTEAANTCRMLGVATTATSESRSATTAELPMITAWCMGVTLETGHE
jgi:hypothetical protein